MSYLVTCYMRTWGDDQSFNYYIESLDELPDLLVKHAIEIEDMGGGFDRSCVDDEDEFNYELRFNISEYTEVAIDKEPILREAREKLIKHYVLLTSQ